MLWTRGSEAAKDKLIMSEKVLEVKNLTYSFNTYGGTVKAVRDVSFSVNRGEILGIVGESGCGKSVTAQSILRLNPEPPGFSSGGEIIFNGHDLMKLSIKELRRVRGQEIGFIFQDPMTSLNPTMKVGDQIAEVFHSRRDLKRHEIREKVIEMMKHVGISDVEKRYNQYPHELSGGMKQRIMIAMALVSRPSLIICDEPTTSLDVTIEAQILDLLLELRNELDTAIIMITPDLGVIAKICDRVLVMYGGKIVEEGMVDEIFYETAHPYTNGLLNSIARLDMDKNSVLTPIEGTPPDLFSPPAGCPFAARCEYCMDVCNFFPPKTYSLVDSHMVSCHLKHEYAPEVELKKPRRHNAEAGSKQAYYSEPVREHKEQALITVEGIKRYFKVSGRAVLKAVDGVSLKVYKGETLGLVGESGCGKSTLGRTITRLLNPTEGRILYKDKEIHSLSGEEENIFHQKVQMIFQNPYSSLNPRMTVKEIVGEGMLLHGLATDAIQDDKIEELLNRVGLGKEHMSRFSHEFSGGQRQRIGIARALSVNPEFIVCDEPVSALDVSIQAQVINMLKKLQEDMGLTYLFIAHDLSVVRYISDRIAVMYMGHIVEEAPTEALFIDPQHPYTKLLLSAIPVADPEVTRNKKRIEIRGEVPSPINPGPGCLFADRCPLATDRCFKERPEQKMVENHHYVACFQVG